jgi:hypothetical protein
MMNASQDGQKRAIAWRRNDAWEAAGFFFAIATLSNVLHVAWDAAFKDTIDYEKAFTQSLIFAAVWAVLSMVLKVKPVVLQ